MYTLLIGNSGKYADIGGFLNVLRDGGHLVIFKDACIEDISRREVLALIPLAVRVIFYRNDDFDDEFYQAAYLNGVPVLVAGLDEVYDPPHPTLLQSPIQTKAFWETIGKIYRTHLDKNADYSPANILGTGSIGVVTRLWDKTARLLNLAGFKLHMETSEYVAPKEPKNESIADSFLDLASYGIIGLLLMRNQWGR